MYGHVVAALNVSTSGENSLHPLVQFAAKPQAYNG
jgi:hypothetical protein